MLPAGAALVGTEPVAAGASAGSGSDVGGTAGCSVGAGANALVATSDKTAADALATAPVCGAGVAATGADAADLATAAPKPFFTGAAAGTAAGAGALATGASTAEAVAGAVVAVGVDLRAPKPRRDGPLAPEAPAPDEPAAGALLSFSVLLTRTVDCSAWWRGFMCR